MSTPVSAEYAADMLKRIRELHAEPATTHVTDQHVISRVILKRFAASSGPDLGLIYPFRRKYPNARHRPYLGPAGCGKVPNFVSFASASVERLWQATENKLHAALLAMDAGKLFASPEHLATIKDAIALHFTRSIAARIVHYRVWEQIYTNQRRLWLTELRPLLEQQFYTQKGLYAAGKGALESFLDEIMRPSVELANTGALFRVRVEDLFRQARERTSASSLEILTSGESEFLIGDVPALTIRHDRTEVGVLGGIALGDAHSVILPLGPKHLVALAKSNRTADLSAAQVEAANARQIAGSIEYIYLRPGSGLEGFVRSALAGASGGTGV